MGGSSYDRDVYSGSSYSGWGTSSESKSRLSRNSLDGTMKPNGKIIKSTTKNPIVIVLDVTGSNINFARLVYDKMPMFYGQIEEKKYLDDFDIAILAVGDSTCDSYPLQVGNFAKGIELDSWMEKLVLEGGGGYGLCESYQLAAHYLNKNCEFDKNATPVVFFIADEKAYDEVNAKECSECGLELEQSYDPFPLLNKKFGNNVFVMLNKYGGREFRDEITESWKSKMPNQHTIQIKEEKSIVDLMLGIIALLNKRKLKSIESDMLSRGQTKERLENVRNSLLELSQSKDLISIDEVHTEGLSLVKTLKPNNKGKRL